MSSKFDQVIDFISSVLYNILDIEHDKERSMNLGELIKSYRANNGYSMDDFAAKSGLSKAYISILERNINPISGKPAVPSLETIKSVSSAMNIDFNDVIAMLDGSQQVALAPSGFEPMPEMSAVPIVGNIACGEPILAAENLNGVASVPASWRATFCLICKGDSMEPRIQDGDVVAIRKQERVENGEIAAVRIDGEATLKHVYLCPNYIELRPENTAYESIIKIGAEMNEVHIEGKAVGLCRKM